MSKADELQEVCDRLLIAVSDLVQDYDPMAVAAVMMTQSLSMYKTALPDEDFNMLVSSILDRTDKVKKFTYTPENLH